MSDPLSGSHWIFFVHRCPSYLSMKVSQYLISRSAVSTRRDRQTTCTINKDTERRRLYWRTVKDTNALCTFLFYDSQLVFSFSLYRAACLCLQMHFAYRPPLQVALTLQADAAIHRDAKVTAAITLSSEHSPGRTSQSQVSPRRSCSWLLNECHRMF